MCPVSTYRVGLDVSIAFEFRTSRTNGVLLAVSNQASDGLGVEIVQGKVQNDAEHVGGVKSLMKILYSTHSL